MLYSMETLVKKLNRSVSWIRMCFGMFNIGRTRFKTSKKTAYIVPKEKMALIKEYSSKRIRRKKVEYKKRNRDAY